MITAWFSVKNAVTMRIDIGHYLDALEQTSAGPGRGNLRDHLPGFAATDCQAAIKQTRLIASVENYRLVDQRSRQRFGLNIFELLYESGADSFAVIVAPQTAEFNFGHYHLVSAELRGLHCHRAECPRQDVYLVAANSRQYVFIRRHNLGIEPDRLIGELIREIR